MKRKYSKLLTTTFFSLLMLLHANSALALDVYVDPAMTAAVATASNAIKDVHEEQNKKLTAIETANILITAQLQKLHSLEDSVFKYLQNAQMFVHNLYDVKRIMELTAIDIPNQIGKCINAIPGNVEGTVVTAVVNKYATNAVLQMTDLIAFLETLVGTGGYVDGIGSDRKLQKVNLLNSYQRYFIVQKILTTLEGIHYNFRLVETQIRFYRWRDLWRHLDSESWAYYIGAQYIAQDIIATMNRII